MKHRPRHQPAAALCAGKRAFRTYHLGKEVLARVNRKGGSHRDLYRCSCCGDFHIGQPLAPRAARATVGGKPHRSTRREKHRGRFLLEDAA